MRHHWDEWWDRRSQEWKAKLFVSLILGFIFMAGVLIYFVHVWTEKEQILAEAKQFHQSRIEASDKLIVPASRPLAIPALRSAQAVEARPAE